MLSFTRPSTQSALPRHQTSSDGFTLLELLVSITIFSLIVGMAMFSLRYAFGVFRHLDAPFADETRRMAVLRDSVASTFVYIGERSDMFNRNKEFYTYFYGAPDQMTFVTTKPLTITGVALCRLSLRDESVIFEEAPLYANDSNYTNPSLETKERHETVLFSNVKGMNLEYFQGEKRRATLKEELPTLVKMVLLDKDKQQREFYYRVHADFNDKKLLVKALHVPS